MPGKDKARFVELLIKYLDPYWSDQDLADAVDVSNRATTNRWKDATHPSMPQGENLAKLVGVLKITDPADIAAIYEAATGVPQLAAPASPVAPPPTKSISAAHSEYLHSLFDRWGAVRLADILDELRQPVRLLDVYVPLPIDARIRMRGGDNGEVRDWWFDRGERKLDSAEAAEAVELASGRAGLIEKQRTWPEMDIDDPAQIQPLVQVLWNDASVENDDWGDDDFEDESSSDADYGDTKTVTLDAEHAAALQPRLVLIGGPGSGKSSFLRHLTLCLAGAVLRAAGETPKDAADLTRLPGWRAGAYTPIYIELRDLVGSKHFPVLPRTRSGAAPVDLPGIDVFWAYLTDSLKARGLDGVVLELRQLLRGGRVMVLLDGLDEVNRAHDPARQRQIAALVSALQEAGGRNLRILIASRPHAYAVGAAPLPGFGVTRLAPLHRARQELLAHTLLRQLPKAGDAADLMQAIDAAQVGDDMRENPLFFTLWVGLWHVTPSPKRLPATKAGLYRAAVDLLLWRWTRPKNPDPAVIEAIGIDPPALRPVLEALACKTLAQQGEDFALKELLDLLEEAKTDSDGSYPDEMIIDKVDDYLEQHAGILVSPRKRHYRFLHRSFQEHLAACQLTHRTQPAGRPLPIPPEQIFPQGLVAALQQDADNWRNVARLAASELVANNRLPDLWALLEKMSRPYAAEGLHGWPALALLALEIIDDSEMPEPSVECAQVLHQTAVHALCDVTAFPNPAQRLIAGNALARLGDPRPGVTVHPDTGLPAIAWCEIPEFGPDGQRAFLYHDGTSNTPHPGLPTFWIAKYPITYAQFRAFVDAPDGYRNPEWRKGLFDYFGKDGTRWSQNWQLANRPRERVTWPEAVAFCRWLTAQAQHHPELLPDDEVREVLARGGSIRLPTEQEWVKAARGFDDRMYPWGGQEYKVGYANVNETENKVGSNNLQQTSAVGMYPHAASPFGVEEMIGNVWEYCLNKFDNHDDISLGGSDLRAMRGGSRLYNYVRSSVAARDGGIGDDGDDDGFRVVCAASP